MGDVVAGASGAGGGGMSARTIAPYPRRMADEDETEDELERQEADGFGWRYWGLEDWDTDEILEALSGLGSIATSIGSGPRRNAFARCRRLRRAGRPAWTRTTSGPTLCRWR